MKITPYEFLMLVIAIAMLVLAVIAQLQQQSENPTTIGTIETTQPVRGVSKPMSW